MQEHHSSETNITDQANNDIAIIAMTGKFPGADSVETFWENLANGIESVTFFDHQQMKEMGIDEHLLDNPKFVAADAVLDDIDKFDARFFNIPPREAEIMDPQQRLFLEAAWEVFERAGYATDKYDGRVGVYAGSALSGYLMRNLKSNPGLIESIGTFKTMLANDKDFLSTRISYKMGFTGPSLNVNTLCSSSSVAIHLACESLLNFQSDIALAGGVSIQITRNEAFFYQEGSIGSPDGHCRAFDERAAGTVSGSGLGVVMLKRLDDAIEDNDNILAVIKGSAINNDGANKASYTAPSSDGQAEVITEAQEVAGIDPDTISYIEAHGTGTNLGDPIEVAGLTKAFQRSTDRKNYCALGSVKTNIGHLVTAGGVASLIKTVMALQHKKIPASLNFNRPNPKIDFDNSPFFVNTTLSEWHSPTGVPRRAGVSSFGIGGTNAHLVVEEHNQQASNDTGRENKLFLLSAKTDSALAVMNANLAKHLIANPEINLNDVAYTLQEGRCDFEYRQAIVAKNQSELLARLRAEDGRLVFTREQKTTERSVVFLFPGQGAQYSGMGAELYKSEAVFKACVDQCSDILTPLLGLDIRSIIFEESTFEESTFEESTIEESAATQSLSNTAMTQPALFVIEYALAKLWQHWGVQPESMLGHSIGEYVAACLADVFSVNDALTLVVHRARLMASMPSGAMLSVSLSSQAVQAYLTAESLTVAAENGKTLTVVSGQHDDIQALQQQLEKEAIQHTLLRTSHAFHSSMMDAALPEFERCFAGITLSTPNIAFISNVTGNWITDEQATSPKYWLDQLRQPVKFLQGITTLADDAERLFLEVGPGHSLSQLSKQCVDTPLSSLHSLPVAKKKDTCQAQLMSALGQLWLAGIKPDWSAFYQEESPTRTLLPTYPFERQRYWIEEARQGVLATNFDNEINSNEDVTALLETSSKAFEKAQFSVDLHWDKDLVDNNELQKNLTDLLLLKEKVKQLVTDFTHNSSINARISSVGIGAISSSDPESINQNILSSLSQRPNISTKYVEATTDNQKLMVEHWQDVLGISPVGIYDDFFELGGHSLLAAALATKMKSQFDVEIPLADLLASPIIADLAELLETKLWLKNNKQDEQQATDTEVQFEEGTV